MISRFATEYLSFDDLTILPARNGGASEAVSLATQASRRFALRFPVIAAAMPSVTETAMAIAMGEFGGLGVLHRFSSIEVQASMVRAVAQHVPDLAVYPAAAIVPGRTLLCAASCAPGDLERGHRLCASGAHILFLDTPNPCNEEVLAGVARMRRELDVDLVIGSVVDAETARLYLDLGIDGIKVGLGAGALCSIRRTAGVGAPQVTALANVCAAVAGAVPIIADGGAACEGDIVKALALGASSVMLGSMLSSCDETPGEVIEVDGRRMKQVAGLRLADFELSVPTGYPAIDAFLRDHPTPRVEGGDRRVVASGPCHLTLLQILRCVRTGIHMAGARDLPQLRMEARLVRVSPSGAREAGVAK